MILTNEQKELIKKIERGDIYNLESFFKEYYSDCLFSYNFDIIQSKKKADYEKNKEPIEKYLKKQKKYGYKEEVLIDRYITNHTKHFSDKALNNYKHKLLNYQIDKSKFSRPNNSNNENIDLTKDTVYCISDYSEIKNLVYTLAYLENEGYITLTKINGDKSHNKLFYKKVKNTKDVSQKDKLLHLKKEIESNEPAESIHELSDIRIYRENDLAYADEVIINNYELEKLCEPYIGKKIFVKESLIDFVKYKFMSIDKRRFIVQTRLTWIAIISSIILSALSIYFTFTTNKDNSDFWRTNEQQEYVIMESIFETLESIDSSLDTIKKSAAKVNTEEIAGKLKSIIDQLDDIITNP